MTIKEDLSKTTEAILLITNWEQENLPLEGSKLAFDLLALCTHHHVSGSPLTIKHLNILMMRYSHAGVRNQLRRCVRDGWLGIISSNTDKRSRVIIAEPRLLSAMEEYAYLLRSTYAKCN